MTTAAPEFAVATPAPTKHKPPFGPGASKVVDVTVEIIHDVQRWSQLRPQWDELFEQSPTASPPLRFEWLWNWWLLYGSTYGEGGTGLRILAIWRGPLLLGILPLYEGVKHESTFRVRRLGFLSSGEAEFEETCADYMDMLHLPGQEHVCIEALADVLANHRGLSWHELELDLVSARSPLVQLMSRLPSRIWKHVRDRGVCYLCDLSQGVENYLRRLSKRTRESTRRRLRKAESCGVRIVAASDAAEAETFYRRLVELHQRRWNSQGLPGCFVSERFTEFHRRLARLWVPQGKALILLLMFGDRAVAAEYGMVLNGRFYSYCQGAPQDSPLNGPGTTCTVMMQQYLAAHGFETFDFLASAVDSFKQSYATGCTPLVRLRAVRPGARVVLEAGARLLHRAWRKMCRILNRVSRRFSSNASAGRPTAHGQTGTDSLDS